MSFLVKLVFPAFVTTSFGLGQLGLTKKTKESSTMITVSSESSEKVMAQETEISTEETAEQSLVSTDESKITQTSTPVTEPTTEELPAPTNELEAKRELMTYVEEKGNCKVIDSKEDLIGNFTLAESTYISVDCANIVDSESILSKWTGFFPISFFNKDSQSSLSIGKKFDIGIEEPDPSEEDTEPYKTVFKSEKFANKSFTGIWGSESAEDAQYKEETIYEVFLTGTSSEKFYLYSANS